MFNSKTTFFTDKQKAHIQFWNKYERPPKKEYWDFIVERRDLLVPQDIRERKGSFFTPQIWVELSQKYIADALGEDWQDKYYVWDLAAGTGNLLAGLTNKYNIWGSTIDKQDVDIIKDRIKNGANLLESHIFQFDFLNGDLEKLPPNLLEIIKDPEKRKKLVIYINPPYAEVSSVGKKGKAGVNKSNMHDKYAKLLGNASREIFALFFARIFYEIKDCILAEFSTLKILQGSAFSQFREIFQAKLKKCFIVPANSFDNVKGEFPIGFKIWDTSINETFKKIKTEVYETTGRLVSKKTFNTFDKQPLINKWISSFKSDSTLNIGFLAGTNGNDFQQNKIIYILNSKNQMANPRGIWINEHNLIPASVFMACRRCMEITWINYYDQFFSPDQSWSLDSEFQTNSLAFILFHEKNLISSKQGINHWIPFTEEEIGAKDNFMSHFLTDYLNGENINDAKSDFFYKQNKNMKFSLEAKALFKTGKQIWKYYHQQPNSNVNASLYDIREYFQGRNETGKMNNSSEDEQFTKLNSELRQNLQDLSKIIQPKIFEHGFLKE